MFILTNLIALNARKFADRLQKIRNLLCSLITFMDYQRNTNLHMCSAVRTFVIVYPIKAIDMKHMTT